MCVQIRWQRTGLCVISVLLTPGYGITCKIVVISFTFSDLSIILRTFTGGIVGITFVLAPLGVRVDIYVDIALNSIGILTVRQEANTGKSGRRREKNRESGGNGQDRYRRV